MKRTFLVFWILAIMAFALLPALFFLHGAQLGDGTNATDGTNVLAGALAPVWAALTARHGWLLAVMSWMVVFRSLFKPTMGRIEQAVKNSPSKLDDEFLAKLEGSLAFYWFCWALDFFASIKLGQLVAAASAPSNPSSGADGPSNQSGKGGGNSNGITTALGMAFVLAIFCALAGQACAKLDKQGAYHGDQFLYDADWVIDGAYETLHAFVQWEYDNRAALKSRPEVTQSADQVRLHAREWIDRAIALRDAYAGNPNAQNRDALQRGVDVLRQVLATIAQYQSKDLNQPQEPSTR